MTVLHSGDVAPNFILDDQGGNRVALKQCLGSKVLLYFYPKADTPGCTSQACSIRDNFHLLRENGIICIGISPDMVTLQKKFIDKYQLPFTLLSDTTHDIAECYGVWQEKVMYGKKIFGIIRSAFLIDESGIIIQTWYKVKPDETVPNVLTIISQ